ncbi:MAG TPA: PQQ-dependent sugar dehydrogenase [Novosphingobium sp.]|nr:PQQ-dependent sugar dehydrogenase [Novosphingobium sp.]
MQALPIRGVLSPLALLLASCGTAATGESPVAPAIVAEDEAPFTVTEMATFDQPWAMAWLDARTALVTQKRGRLMLWREGAAPVVVPGTPAVAFGGQGGFGDVAVRPLGDNRFQVWLSWAEAGPDDTRGAAVGLAELALGDNPALSPVEVVWRQSPKVTGRGHYGHRFAFAPDGSALFISSGDRQKLDPAQDPASDLGKIIRLPLDADGRPSGPAEHYSLGHRNPLGLAFDGAGQLWTLEHGPAGGGELNLVRQGANYGWPLVSQGDHYDGRAIPRHATRPDLAAPALAWTPVIAPGGMIVYRGSRFADWQGQAVIAALGTQGIVRVALDGGQAREVARYDLGRRIRAIAEHPDGSIWVLDDGPDARLLKLVPKPR